jgi:hypothetical protein
MQAGGFESKRAVAVEAKRAIDVCVPPGPGQHDSADPASFKYKARGGATFGVSREMMEAEIATAGPGPGEYSLPDPNSVQFSSGFTKFSQDKDSRPPLSSLGPDTPAASMLPSEDVVSRVGFKAKSPSHSFGPPTHALGSPRRRNIRHTKIGPTEQYDTIPSGMSDQCSSVKRSAPRANFGAASREEAGAVAAPGHNPRPFAKNPGPGAYSSNNVAQLSQFKQLLGKSFHFHLSKPSRDWLIISPQA